MSRRRRLLGVYARIARIYRAWAPSLILLAVVVFVPVGFVDALLNQIDTNALNVGEEFRVAAFLSASIAVTASGLFGEVFFSGAVAISLTHPEHEHPPSLRQIARRISYLKLIVVDVIYVVIVDLGLVLLIVPGVVLFVYLALTGPVVELEKRSVREAFARSFRLVRGHFWMVAAVVIPVELLGDAANDAVVGLSHAAFGHGLVASWIGESASNVITAPFYAVAVVLLTLDLIHHRGGDAPALKPRPDPIPAGGVA